jgi:DNA-binding IclR family transcriptional regulator
MAVLEIVANAPHPPRFTDILRESDQPRGTLHRQLSNLVEEGLLVARPDQSYELGLKLLTFAARSWASSEFRTVAEPHLQRLHELTGETVHLAVLRETQVIYLDKVEGTQTLRMHSQIGNASPAYCTGVGKAALSALDPAVLSERINAMRFHRYTETTIHTAKALRTELNAIRKAGVAYDREEHEPGIHCVAAPIHSAARSLVGGVSITGPVFRISREQLEGLAHTLRATAKEIMTDLETRLGPRT